MGEEMTMTAVNGLSEGREITEGGKVLVIVLLSGTVVKFGHAERLLRSVPVKGGGKSTVTEPSRVNKSQFAW